MIDTTTGSAIDLAPILNPVIQLAGLVITACASTVAVFAINWVRNKLKLQKLEENSATQAHIDDIAQKIIGGAFARANVKPGEIAIGVHNGIVADAGNKIAQALGTEITKLGAPDVAQRAKEIVENRLGMMAAAAQGTPIPNPSAPVQSAPTATTTTTTVPTSDGAVVTATVTPTASAMQGTQP